VSLAHDKGLSEPISIHVLKEYILGIIKIKKKKEKKGEEKHTSSCVLTNCKITR
jgi:hypothetical protein